MREHPRIGALHRLPLRPIRRSLNEGLQSDWASWSGTPRQMADLAGWVRRDPEARWWFRYTLAFGAGAIAALVVLTG